MFCCQIKKSATTPLFPPILKLIQLIIKNKNKIRKWKQAKTKTTHIYTSSSLHLVWCSTVQTQSFLSLLHNRSHFAFISFSQSFSFSHHLGLVICSSAYYPRKKMKGSCWWSTKGQKNEGFRAWWTHTSSKSWGIYTNWGEFLKIFVDYSIIHSINQNEHLH